ncbi:transcriptional regulator, LysR family protein [Pseudovibrio sp. FO-BEG1]|uniref:LysR family transcriptional regulator n=1 Tax=Pseudovibrio sp. (strain FO-BEG1) TaxID=911045 RepID=UPI000238C5B1|nr:LysR family transcriptional regulator [Pseudovibrio sp. FO-BEG1]AEV37812.1 transcriptional regulator, LysR family protein [Pseudovibrio sp. FO-BEG1]
MDKLRKMALYCRVVELGSFVAAAQDQNVSPAIVGRHVSDLEAMLKVRLINRTTRSMEVTEVGHRYYQGCKISLAQLAALEQDMTNEEGEALSGIIRLAAPEGLGAPHLLSAIESFQGFYPNILFDLVLDNGQTDFISENVDLSIRLAISMQDSSLIVRKLTDTRLCFYAAPSYLAKHGTPKKLEDLDQHACLAFGASRFGDSWPIVTDMGLSKYRLPWRVVVNQTQFYRKALMKGMGIGLLPEIMVAEQAEDGSLTPLSLDVTLPEVGIYAVYPNREFQPKRVSLFLKHLAERFGKVE